MNADAIRHEFSLVAHIGNEHHLMNCSCEVPAGLELTVAHHEIAMGIIAVLWPQMQLRGVASLKLVHSRQVKAPE